MAIDAQEVHDAANEVISSARQLRDLATGMITPVAGTTLPHADTIAALKAEAAGVKAEWETARDALSTALTP